MARNETQTARQLRETRDLIAALRKQEQWLDKAAHWEDIGQRFPALWNDKTRRHYANCMEQVDHYQPEVLLAAYKLFEVDALFDAYQEVAPDELERPVMSQIGMGRF